MINQDEKNNKTLEENNQNNNHLGNKLNKHFSPLLFIGVFGGFLIYITFSVALIKKAQGNQTIKAALTNLNLQQSEQYIFEVERIIMYRTQECFDFLRKIAANAEFLFSIYNKGQVKDVNDIKNYINKYSVNLNNVEDSTEKDETKGIWGRNEDIVDSGEVNEDNIKELFIFTGLNPLLNAIYKSINFKEHYVENIFVINNKKEIFYDYPLTGETYFKNGNNRAFCFNEMTQNNEKVDELLMPDKYDYHCQEWFADSINLHQMINYDYYISSPYYIQKNEKILVLTLCLNSTKLSDIKDDQIEIGDYYLFCLNVRYQIILDTLEILNHKISGYFFVTRVHTQKAFYYPKRQPISINKTTAYYFENFDIEEFELNDDYYLDELNEYLKTTTAFISTYNSNEVNSLLDIREESLKGEFIKDNQKYLYYILPIFNHYSSISINLMNIVYICPEKVIDNKLELITKQTINIETLSFAFFLFLIQTVIVQILVGYLIYAIAFNIVLPMKNIKKVFEKLNGDEGEVEEETDNLLLKDIKISMTNNNISTNNANKKENEENPQEKGEKDKNDINSQKNRTKSVSSTLNHRKRRETTKKKGKGNLNHIVNINNKNNINEEFDLFDEEKDNFLSNYKESDSDTENEEDYINIKSKDIQDLFCKMINVKNSLEIVNSDEQNEVTKLSEILFASEIFKEIKNDNAKNICLSNIGNILLKLKKYDIAILHLIESDTFLDEENKKDYKDNDNNMSYKNKKKKRKNKKNSLTKRSPILNDLNQEEIDQKTIEENKPLIESRYPKLIYCYKQFFKSLRKLKKINSQEIINNKLDEYELFISKEYHMLKNFKEYIEKFVNICQLEGNYLKSNTRYITALMEKIEFIIKYEIINNNINYYNNNNNDFAEKMSTLHDLFNKVKKLIKQNKEIIKPKNILKSLLKEDSSNEIDEIPNSILMQRLYYYKGCLAFKCFHYLEAVKKFQNIIKKSSNKITDANIVVKCFKKLIKIAEIFKEKCNYIKKREEENILKSYIIDKSKEIKKFITVDRDFIILISTNAQNIDFFISALENTRYIIDNYIKNNDKFSIAFVSSDRKSTGGLKILTKLESKGEQKDNVIIEFIQSIKQDYELLTNYLEDEEDNIQYILQKAKSYGANKNMNKERNTLFIFFGNKGRLSQSSIDFLSSEELDSYINEDKEKLLLILQDNEQNENTHRDDNEINSLIPVKEKDLDFDKINKKICSYIHFDEIQKIKKEVMMFGKINPMDNYNFEKYESKKYD